MKLWSQSFAPGQRIPARYAAGKHDDKSIVTFSDNLNPHLAWDEVPAGTRSFTLICHDPDVPSRGDDVNQPDREVPAELPRVDFFHWVLVDLPATLRQIAEGEFSRSFKVRGKAGPATLHGARHGLNDYTGWFANDHDMNGEYFGYDGPFPPFNDRLVHRYVFTLFALDVPHCAVDGHFTGTQVRGALHGHVLAQAEITGTYSLNRQLG
jgi:Raf kinase inhibitor-like YbhB/YbcL family protein